MVKQSEIDSLKTSEQKYKDVQSDKMYLSKRMMTSEAFRSLKTAAACQVYLIFRYKCRMKKVPAETMRCKKEWQITNNGEIQFTYGEALGKWKISNNRFTKAIDELIRVGLIDIAKSVLGLHKDCTLYAISGRWEKFGTDEFIVKKRQKRKQALGFAKGNSCGKNSGKKQNQHSLVTVDNSCESVLKQGQVKDYV